MKERETLSTRAGEEKWPQQAWECLNVEDENVWLSQKDERGQVRQTQADQYENKREPRLTLWIKYSSHLSAVIISDCLIEDIPQGHFCAHDPCKNSFHDFSHLSAAIST